MVHLDRGGLATSSTRVRRWGSRGTRAPPAGPANRAPCGRGLAYRHRGRQTCAAANTATTAAIVLGAEAPAWLASPGHGPPGDSQGAWTAPAAGPAGRRRHDAVLWWVDRAAGLVLLVLLTAAIVTGLRRPCRARVARPAVRHARPAPQPGPAGPVPPGAARRHGGDGQLRRHRLVAGRGSRHVRLPAGVGRARHGHRRPAVGVVATSLLRHRMGLQRLAGGAPARVAGLARRRRSRPGPRHGPARGGRPWAVLPVCACLAAVASRRHAARGARPAGGRRARSLEVVR